MKSGVNLQLVFIDKGLSYPQSLRMLRNTTVNK